MDLLGRPDFSPAVRFAGRSLLGLAAVVVAGAVFAVLLAAVLAGRR